MPAASAADRPLSSRCNDGIRKTANLDSLPDTYRAALVLHDLEELSAEQTAQICECSAATAKIRIHRARLRLKAALQAQCAFYRDREGVCRCDRKP